MTHPTTHVHRTVGVLRTAPTVDPDVVADWQAHGRIRPATVRKVLAAGESLGALVRHLRHLSLRHHLAAPIDPTPAGVSDREQLAPASHLSGAAGEPNRSRRGRGPGR